MEILKFEIRFYVFTPIRILQLIILNFALIVADVKDATDSEELVLNTVATLNNLSFYNDTDSVIQNRQVEITKSKSNSTILLCRKLAVE